METLTVEVDDRLAVVTITRPEVRNALSRTVIAELLTTLDDLRERGDLGRKTGTGFHTYDADGQSQKGEGR